MCQIPVTVPKDSRASFRHKLRSRRRGLTGETRASFDISIRRATLELLRLHKAKSVVAYWPFNGEPDITPLCLQLMNEGYQFALPVLSGTGNHTMKFHAWRADTRLEKNWYGIPEPQETAAVSLSTVDILLMPLVGYDRLGNRLGVGGGYYDRHLESQRESDSPLRVGVAYKLQEIDLIENNTWDIPLHGVVNEHGWFTFV